MPADAAASSPSVIDPQQRIDELSSMVRESESRLALVTDAVAEGIYEWNIETNALWQSQRLAKIFGLEGRELKAADWNELVHFEDFERYRSALRDCFKGITGRLDCEYRVKHTDGSYRWLEDRAVPVRNAAGLAVRLVGAVTDVTARKESEQALSEALEQQTATAEVLQVINSSPDRLEPVFEAMLQKALRLCEADAGFFGTRDGDGFSLAALQGLPPDVARAFADSWRQEQGPRHVHAESGAGRIERGEPIVHILDSAGDAVYRSGNPGRRILVDVGGARTQLCAALRKDGALLGVIIIWRREVRAFTDKQMALLQNFAAQAVIAMENARLLGELRQRTDDLTESLEYQTATSELLEVISRSASNVQPVMDTILAAAARLCGTSSGAVAIRRDNAVRIMAVMGVSTEVEAALRERNHTDQRTLTGRTVNAGQVIHVDDLAADADYSMPEIVRIAHMRTALGVPLLRDGESVGAIVLSRDHVEPFSERQIALIRTFADQAVIAMANARLLSQLRERTDDLTESLEYQTATSELLEVISRSTSEVQPVLETMWASAARLCETSFGGVAIRQGDVFHFVVAKNVRPELDEMLRRHGFHVDRSSAIGRVALTKNLVHIPDAQVDPEYSTPTTDAAGIRTLLGVPLLREGEVIGVIVLVRDRVKPFSERQIALVKTFADQAVIAMENARLLGELTRREEELRVTFDHMGDGVVMFDADLRLASWNRNFQELLDVPDSFLASRPGLEDYVRLLVQRGELGDRDPDKEVARYRERATRQWSTERTRPDGRVLEVRNNPVPGGGAVLIYSDITRRKMAEAEIAAARDAAEAALERQTATADILKVIASSPTDVQPVLDAVVKATLPFCEAADAVIILREGDGAIFAAHEGPFVVAPGSSFPLNRETSPGLAILDGQTTHFPDIASLDPVEFAAAHRIAAAQGFRAAVAAPLLREGMAIGSVALRKPEPGPFAPQQIALLETFAAQAVIAIENVRLFTELREALEQQTATAEILRVISQSPADVVPVLEAVARAAVRFCGAEDVAVGLRDGDSWHGAAHVGPIPLSALGNYYPLARQTLMGRAMIDGQTMHAPDLQALDTLEFPDAREIGERLGLRAALIAPMMREGMAIGAINLRRRTPGPFAPRQIALLEAFAAQAVIAIENVRLFTELRESLEQQTATSEVLRAISQSPTDVQPVLEAVSAAARRFCGALDASITLREGEQIALSAHAGDGIGSEPIGTRVALDRGTMRGRSILDAATVHFGDVLAADPVEYGPAQQLARKLGFRAIVSTPMLRDGRAIGCVTLRKIEPAAFTPRQIELLETFAAQAVIAIENVRLFTELRDSLERLKAAQANLIQSEKMASLGQLTAGIAHEIKNPLNFVNNFAGLSVELLDELKDAAAPVLAGMSEDARAEFGETVELITSNLEKIAEHGRRADGIVKSMLAHSRGGTGDWQVSNINALVEEALNLAYHGARAQDQDFNVILERDFTSEIKPIEVVPQDVTRVFLNLFGNGFYAAKKRQERGAGSDYRPTLTVSTLDLGEAVEIKVRDNGTGIPPEVRAKLFQPFFTTKPTGEGTGLGLSISYDIVTQQHGGSIEVESEPGSFTEFTVRLPRRRRAA